MTESKDSMSPRDGKLFKLKNSEKSFQVKKFSMVKGNSEIEIPGLTHQEFVNACIHLHMSSIDYLLDQAFDEVLGSSSYTVAAVVSGTDARANLFPYCKRRQADDLESDARSYMESDELDMEATDDLEQDGKDDDEKDDADGKDFHSRYDEYNSSVEKRQRHALKKFGRRTKQPKRIRDDLIIGPEHRVVGCVTFHIYDLPTFKYIQVDLLSVSPIYRGSGLGTYLLDHVINIMNTEGYSCINLISTLKAIPFYIKKGFKDDGNLALVLHAKHEAADKRRADDTTDDEPTAKRHREEAVQDRMENISTPRQLETFEISNVNDDNTATIVPGFANVDLLHAMVAVGASRLGDGVVELYRQIMMNVRQGTRTAVALLSLEDAKKHYLDNREKQSETVAKECDRIQSKFDDKLQIMDVDDVDDESHGMLKVQKTLAEYLCGVEIREENLRELFKDGVEEIPDGSIGIEHRLMGCMIYDDDEKLVRLSVAREASEYLDVEKYLWEHVSNPENHHVSTAPIHS